MPTDFKRLFENLTYNPDRQTGTTYTMVYQSFGHCMQKSGNLAIITIKYQSRSTYLFNMINDISEKLKFVSIKRISENDVQVNYKDKASIIKVMALNRLAYLDSMLGVRDGWDERILQLHDENYTLTSRLIVGGPSSGEYFQTERNNVDIPRPPSPLLSTNTRKNVARGLTTVDRYTAERIYHENHLHEVLCLASLSQHEKLHEFNKLLERQRSNLCI